VVFRYISSFKTSKADRRRRNTIGVKDNAMLLAVTNGYMVNCLSGKNSGQLNKESSRERTLYPDSYLSGGHLFLLYFYLKHFKKVS
jgi:hypothetical protein